MARLVAMFPGQGSQYVGMAKELLREFPYAKATFEEAEDAIGVPLRKLCNDGPDEDLKLTANTQPCLLATEIAIWRVLRNEIGLEAQLFMGHSLGEYAALVASGRLAYAHAIGLVRHRGEAMQNAVPAGIGAMSAILNMSNEDVEALCKEISKPKHIVEPANYNSPGQIVIAGHRRSVAEFGDAAKEKGGKAIALPVSAPFHSTLMAPAKEVMRPLLQATELVENGTSIIPNLSGEFGHHYYTDYLIDQIDHPVLWTQSLEACRQAEFDQFIEVGPGKVLAGLAKRCLGKDLAITLTDPISSALSS